VILHGGDEQAPLKIECFFYGDEDNLNRLGKGQALTVGGEYAGRVSHVQLRGCVIVK